MATTKYIYDYDMREAYAEFDVDTEIFKADHALMILSFFTWDWNRENDPVDEVMKKFAIRAIEIASVNNFNAYGVSEEFKDQEGFMPVDGSHGIKLIQVEGYQFDEEKLSIETSKPTSNV